MVRWLNPEQKARLTEVIDEALKVYTGDGLARQLRCSSGFLSGIKSGKTQGVSEYFALYLCRGLGVNPYYVTEGLKPKYKKWDVAFFVDIPK